MERISKLMAGSPVLVGVLAALGSAACYAVLGLSRWYAGHSAAFDLGIFAQVVDSWSHGELPYSRIRGIPTFAEHFSPILAALGPIWTLWPTPLSLIIAQAVLLGIAFGLMIGHLSTDLGIVRLALLAVGGMTSYAVVSAVRFDFHEVAFAPSFLTLVLIDLRRECFGMSLVGSFGLILTKEDLGATILVAAVLWWWTHRTRRPAIVLAVVGLAGLLAGFGTIAIMSHRLGIDGVYFSRLGDAPQSAVEFVADLPEKLVPTGAFILGCLVLGVWHRLALLALPTLLWRALAQTPAYSHLGWHYDLVLWPIMMICAGTTLQRWPELNLLRRAIVVTAAALCTVIGGRMIVGATPSSLAYPNPGLADVAALTERMPAGASVAAQDGLAAYLVPRFDVSVLDIRSNQAVHYVLLSSSESSDASLVRSPLCARMAMLQLSAVRGYESWRSGDLHLIKLPHSGIPELSSCR